MPTNEAGITITDGALGSVSIAPATVQAVIGCCSAGVAATPLVTASKSTLVSTFGYGPMVEAAAMIIDAGGTVVACKTTGTTPGACSAVTFTGSGTSVVSVSVGTSFDDYYVKCKVVKGGTRGTGPILLQWSLDAGRTYGPIVDLGTATTYAIPQTGITVAFAAGTLVTGDSFVFTATAPLWATGDVSAAITAINALAAKWGAGIHVVGKATGANASTIQGYLDTLATGFRYTYAILDTVDATGGLLVNDAAWTTALLADYSAVSAVRVIPGAGWYNTPSSITNQAVGGLPRYRRPGTWAACARLVQIPPYALLSRVADGALGRIVQDPTNDPQDTYNYHDERTSPALGQSGGANGRFMAFRTRIGYPGFFVDEPWMASPPGSDFSLLPYRAIMDLFCDLLHQVIQIYINGNARLNNDGTIVEKDARTIETFILAKVNENLTNKGYVSSASYKLSRVDNIATGKIVNGKGRIAALGYILEFDTEVGFQNPNAVSGS